MNNVGCCISFVQKVIVNIKAIYGEFGIRLEDCLYVTDSGAQYFSQPSPAIDKPFA